MIIFIVFMCSLMFILGMLAIKVLDDPTSDKRMQYVIWLVLVVFVVSFILQLEEIIYWISRVA